MEHHMVILICGIEHTAEMQRVKHGLYKSPCNLQHGVLTEKMYICVHWDVSPAIITLHIHV